MSQEYSDRQELESEIKDNSKQIETLGESQKEYQEDIESLQEKLKMLKSHKGVYANSDNKMIATVEAAIQTRETNVEECKEKIGEVKTQMDGKLENLKKRIISQEQRIGKMENLVDSLNHKNDTIVNNLRGEIQHQRDDLDDAKDKSNGLLKIIEIAGAFAAGIGLAAQGIANLLSSLQSIGLFR
jgi:DNA repair exonuclease SbcCD ATPase subunit